MELKNQVCSLELAKKLKELGVEQESLWYWHFRQVTDRKEPPIIVILKDRVPLKFKWLKSEIYSAFTVAELGEILTKKEKRVNMPCFCNQANTNYWIWSYGAYPNYAIADTEADIRAKMLIYLLRNGREINNENR